MIPNDCNQNCKTHPYVELNWSIRAHSLYSASTAVHSISSIVAVKFGSGFARLQYSWSRMQRVVPVAVAITVSVLISLIRIIGFLLLLFAICHWWVTVWWTAWSRAISRSTWLAYNFETLKLSSMSLARQRYALNLSRYSLYTCGIDGESSDTYSNTTLSKLQVQNFGIYLITECT